MSARNERAYNLAQDWIRWLDTRRFYGRPEHKNILAMLMAERRPSMGEPDGDNSADLQAFNLAVTNLPVNDFIAFVVIYCEYRPERKPVKLIAYEQGVNSPNFYARAHRAAHEVLHIADKLVELNRQMRKEVECVY